MPAVIKVCSFVFTYWVKIEGGSSSSSSTSLSKQAWQSRWDPHTLTLQCESREHQRKVSKFLPAKNEVSTISKDQIHLNMKKHLKQSNSSPAVCASTVIVGLIDGAKRKCWLWKMPLCVERKWWCIHFSKVFRSYIPFRDEHFATGILDRYRN